jgi:hypothetical protein
MHFQASPHTWWCHANCYLSTGDSLTKKNDRDLPEREEVLSIEIQ